MEKDLDSRVREVEVAVGKLEVTTQDHKDEIKILKDDSKLLHRMVINQEVLANMVKENQEIVKESTKTLHEINTNLNNLNKSHEDLKVKVEKIEKVQEEEQKKNSIDVSGLPKKAIVKGVGIAIAVITAVITTWVMIQLGLSKGK